MNSTTVAILAALVLALGYIYIENSEAQLPRGNNFAAPPYPQMFEQSQRFSQPPTSTAPTAPTAPDVSSCLAKEKANNNTTAYVRKKVNVPGTDEYAYVTLPEVTVACGISQNQSLALGSATSRAVASANLVQIMSHSIETKLVNTLGDGLTEVEEGAGFTVFTEISKRLATGHVPIYSRYYENQGETAFCTCVQIRLFAEEEGEFVVRVTDSGTGINSTSGSGSTGASLPPALSQNAAPEIAPPSYGSSTASPPALDHSEHFDSIVIEVSTLPTGDVKVLTEHAGVYREVLNIESYNVNVAFFDFDFNALLKRWQSERPYTLRALKTLDENSVVISQADDRALGPILHLATDESKLVFRAR